jgi:GNAT superfamily N-acetyltransferase
MAGGNWSVRAWDTEFFGARIAEAPIERVSHLDDVSAWAAAEDVDCVYLRVDGADLVSVVEAVRRGAALVDLRLMMQSAELIGEPSAAIRPAAERDRDWLHQASAELARFSRFSRDDRFPSAKVEEMYRIWVDRCLQEGVIYVAGDDEAFVGGRRGDPPSIDLVYVASAARGQGLGASAVLGAARALGAGPTTVATQVGNLQAQRLYQRLGFVPVSVTAILHLWSTTPDVPQPST